MAVIPVLISIIAQAFFEVLISQYADLQESHFMFYGMQLLPSYFAVDGYIRLCY